MRSLVNNKGTAASKEDSSNTFRFAVLAGIVYWWGGITDQIAGAISLLGSILPEESIVTKLLISLGLGYATVCVLKKKPSVRAASNNVGKSNLSKQSITNNQPDDNRTLVFGYSNFQESANIGISSDPSAVPNPTNRKLKLK